MSETVDDSCNEQSASKWIVYVLGWFVACGTGMGFIGTEPEGLAHTTFVIARALILVPIVIEVFRPTNIWIERASKLICLGLAVVLIFSIEYFVGGWAWSPLGALIGAASGLLIGGCVLWIGWGKEPIEV